MKFDIFNRKRIEMLERELNVLRNVRNENHELRTQLDDAESRIRRILKLKESMPADCVMGNYCEACSFGKKYYYHQFSLYTQRNTTLSGILCGKGESCKNFVQREIEDE